MADIKVKATLDSKRYADGIKRMKSGTRELGTETKKTGQILKGTFAGTFLANIATRFVGMVKRMIGSVISAGSELTDLAGQTGMSVESFQRLDFAAEQAGVKVTLVREAVNRMRIAAQRAIEGDEKLTQAFNDLGISLDKFETMAPDQQFTRLSQAMQEAGGSGKSLRAAYEIVGRQALQLSEVFERAAVGIENMDKGWAGMSERGAHSMDALADGLANLWKGIKNTAAEVIALPVEAVTEITSGEGVGARRAREAREKLAREQVARDKMAEERRLIKAEMEERERAEQELERKRQERHERQERANIQQQAIDQQKEIAKRVKIDVNADTFRRMGGDVGASVSRELLEARRQTTIQSEMSKQLQKISANTAQLIDTFPAYPGLL